MEAISPEELQKLCDDHWEYVESVIRNEYISELAITNGAGLDLDAYCKRLEFHYKSAMAHGFKHGVQWSARPMLRDDLRDILND